MKRKNASKTVTLPSDLSKTPIEIAGKTYMCCFDMDQMADAEEFFNSRGENVNLLRSLSSLGLKSVRAVFAVALHTYHPEIGFKDAQKLLSLPASYKVAAAIGAIWAPTADQVTVPVEE
jgi:hypothetical protein